jgi:2-keto-4-pentenoate hydratase/2-oxohepta-3-ene-1,7-dioic acid hydratase in catechol pathway
LVVTKLSPNQKYHLKEVKNNPPMLLASSFLTSTSSLSNANSLMLMLTTPSTPLFAAQVKMEAELVAIDWTLSTSYGMNNLAKSVLSLTKHS